MTDRLAPAANPEERWQRTRALIVRLGDEVASAPLDRIPALLVDALLVATDGEQACLLLRGVTGVVTRAHAGGDPPAPALVAAGEEAIAAGERSMRPLPDRVAIAAPFRLAGETRGALAIVQRTASGVPVDETAERVACFAAFAAAALRTEEAVARRRDAALEAVHRLVARTAHELNNPLGGVKLYGRLIEQRLAKAGDAYGEGLAQKVGQAVDRLTALIADLAERGRPPETSADRVSINALLGELLARVHDRLTTTPVDAAIDLGAGVGEVTGDAQGLRRAFLHLLTNALDATPPGGRLVVKSLRPDPATVEVVIEDSGTGMDAGTRRLALELFFTTRPTAAGLGLATVQATVDAHGGRLDVESDPGRGTRVSVRLPATAR